MDTISSTSPERNAAEIESIKNVIGSLASALGSMQQLLEEQTAAVIQLRAKVQKLEKAAAARDPETEGREL